MKKKIDLMNRESLIILATQLEVDGHTNKFMKPYVKNDILRKNILDKIKNIKKLSKSKSTSIIPSGFNTNSKNSVNSNSNSNSNSNIASRLRSKSLTNLKKKSAKKVQLYNDIVKLYDVDKCCYPKVKKIVAIGDIHGDLSVAVKALKLAGVISLKIPDNITDIRNINWIGGDTYVVQLGDQIDRVRPNKLVNNLCIEEDNEICDDEGSDLKIIYLFEKLHTQAKKYGGALFSILGNHELMNVDGDFRYVSPKEFAEFGNFFKGEYEKNSKLPYGYKERMDAFKPGGVLSKKLALSRFSVLQIGSWLFVHGGVSPTCSQNYSLNEINGCIKNWLLGNTDDKNMCAINDLYHTDNDDDSPFWSRIFSDMDDWQGEESIKEFNRTINHLNIKNLRDDSHIIKGMVMGHSPQFMYNRGINSSFNNRIWRVDVGASKAFGEIDDSPHCKNRRVQVLVINNDNEFSIVKEKC